MEEGCVGVALRSSSVMDMRSIAPSIETTVSGSNMMLPRLEKCSEVMKSSSSRRSVGIAMMPRGEENWAARPSGSGDDGGDREDMANDDDREPGGAGETAGGGCGG